MKIPLNSIGNWDVSQGRKKAAANKYIQLRYRFSADSKQLARVTGIEQERVLMLLDSFIQR